jgi:hypothetical protein
MMLGALPTRSSAAAAVQNVQSSPQKLQTFAMQTGQTYDASKPIVPLITPQGDDDDDGSDIVETLKKYAPYIIAGGIIIYLILRNKK